MIKLLVGKKFDEKRKNRKPTRIFLLLQLFIVIFYLSVLFLGGKIILFNYAFGTPQNSSNYISF